MDKERVTLRDVLNYEPEKYLSDDELALIRSVFSDKRVLRVLRKVFLPSVGDLDLPIEELEHDVWLVGRDYAMIPDAEIRSIVVGRQDAVKFILGGLIKLKIIANQKEESEEQEIARKKKDSTQ